MKIQVQSYAPDRAADVEALARRQGVHGLERVFQTSRNGPDVPGGAAAHRTQHIAVREDGTVCGAASLLARPFRVHGQMLTVAAMTGPIVEGPQAAAAVDTLLASALAEHPALHVWAAPTHPAMAPLQRRGWPLLATSECIRVLAPQRFLEHAAWWRHSPARALGAQAARRSGLGWLVGQGLNLALSLRSPQLCEAEAEEVGSFSFWCDELWTRCAEHYGALALRDAASLNRLMPRRDGPAGLRLRILRGRQLIGWAIVMDSAAEGHPRFGGLRVGTIVDCLATPEDASDTVGAAYAFLKARGVEVVVSEQGHPVWRAAFRDNGFLIRPPQRIFAASPELQKALSPLDARAPDIHLTPLDGPGLLDG